MKHKQEPQNTKNTITIFYESHSKPVARKIMKKSIDLFKKIGIKAFAVEEAQDIDVQVKYEESKTMMKKLLKVNSDVRKTNEDGDETRMDHWLKLVAVDSESSIKTDWSYQDLKALCINGKISVLNNMRKAYEANINSESAYIALENSCKEKGIEIFFMDLACNVRGELESSNITEIAKLETRDTAMAQMIMDKAKTIGAGVLALVGSAHHEIGRIISETKDYDVKEYFFDHTNLASLSQAAKTKYDELIVQYNNGAIKGVYKNLLLEPEITESLLLEYAQLVQTDLLGSPETNTQE